MFVPISEKMLDFGGCVACLPISQEPKGAWFCAFFSVLDSRRYPGVIWGVPHLHNPELRDVEQSENNSGACWYQDTLLSDSRP